ncbi:uncharacterized protein LOC126982602 isoform X3 [Eriocheir sinensis]|uniref:uncharacterized protein LOC126982602 isoform X3 n=1 Tax=Eriocheir sinensis TaxID=95602 RepID=UPI0021CA4A39|nr:uncharacterized protein LOC126982602 isoform X3 [Eriocheir sinensis]
MYSQGFDLFGSGCSQSACVERSGQWSDLFCEEVFIASPAAAPPRRPLAALICASSRPCSALSSVTMAAVYRTVIRRLDRMVPAKFQPFWNHPAGPKTVFFWAPSFKWSLVIAGLGDAARPAEKLSASQSGALAATGTVWSRYSLVIVPKNWYLFSVNVFVAGTGIFQLCRIAHYEWSKAKALKES